MNQIEIILGPTNTGKTFYAFEQMFSFKNGVFGFPLRLLARENYDKACKLYPIDQIALITGEEKIIPKDAKYFFCTVESMPDDFFEFICVDEIQLSADYERGHIFTQRLLYSRGEQRTIFLGSLTMEEIIKELIPDAEIKFKTRFSQLNFIGHKKIQNIKPRSAIIAFNLGYKWTEIQKGIQKSINSAIPSILILFLVGSLAGSWLLSGIVPALIYYGIQILNAKIFLFAACVICIIVSMATGSSWTTSATIGIALIGIGKALNIPEGLIAGSILSGAYFGDKMSPLSDTTNLAPAVAGTDLFTHINHMIWTTGPSLLIALCIFLFMGFNASDTQNLEGLELIQSTIINNFNISALSFIPLIIVFVMAFKKMPDVTLHYSIL